MVRYVILLFAAVALVIPRAAAVDVEVVVSDYLKSHLAEINEIEQLREGRFRDQALDDRRPTSSIFSLNRADTYGTEWAGQRLVEDISDYSFDYLIARLVEDNLSRAGIEPEGTIRIGVKQFKLENPLNARLKGNSNYATGTIALIGDDGAVLKEHKVRVNFVAKPTLDRSYTGPKYAFLKTEESVRFGPLAAQFVEKALERVYPEHRRDIHGPVLVELLLSGPTSVSSGRFR